MNILQDLQNGINKKYKKYNKYNKRINLIYFYLLKLLNNNLTKKNIDINYIL